MTTSKFYQNEDLLKSIIVYKGTTTADGDLNGDNLICSNLIGSNDFLSGKSVIIMSGLNKFFDQLISSFDIPSGTVYPANNFPNQVLAGTVFYVLSIPSSTALSNIITGIINQISNYNNPIYNTLDILDYWSPPVIQVSLTNVAGNIALPDIVIPGGAIPTGAGPVKANIMFKFRIVENTNGAQNSLSGAQSIFIDVNSGGTFTTDALDFVDQLFTTPASSREGGDVIISSIDIVSFISGLDHNIDNTLNFRWTSALAALANLNFNDIQIGIRILFNFS